MARDGLSPFVLGVALFLTTATAQPSSAADDPDAKFKAQLAVQAALQQGRDCLQRGDYQAAVYCLEKEVPRINGNRDYINALKDAYRGYVRELQGANRTEEARLYVSRLQILDPACRLEGPPPSAPLARAPAPTTSEGPLPTASPAAAPKGIVPRGAAPDDTSGDGGKAQYREALALLDRAGEEFTRENYLAAGKLYEQAHRLDSGAVSEAREQWAYCKLYAVVDALNRHTADTTELVPQVHSALALASVPKLEAFGRDLLRRIQEKAGSVASGVEIRHEAATADGWSQVRSTNFRVLYHSSAEQAEKVARIAEATRTAMARKWFGDAPPTWSPACDIYLHATAQDYARESGAPAASPGHSTMQAKDERVMLRRIDLHCDYPHMLDAVLPHETTHVVLCGRFGQFAVPRWADEGMAVLTEPRERIDLHLRNLPMHRREGALFPVGQLLRMKDYPQARAVGPFYAQSVSVVEFLTSQPGGPRTFVKFVQDGLAGDYESALRRHYGIQGFDDLERRWQEYAFGPGDGATASAAGKAR